MTIKTQRFLISKKDNLLLSLTSPYLFSLNKLIVNYNEITKFLINANNCQGKAIWIIRVYLYHLE